MNLKGYFRTKYLFGIIGFVVFISFLFLSSCKDDLIFPEVVITFPLADTTMQFGDSIPVYYTADKVHLNNVSLLINGHLYETQEEEEGFFNYKPQYQGSCDVYAIADYEGGIQVSSDTLIICALIGHPPDLILHCERIDGVPSYFVGEQLSITVLPEWEWIDINDFKQITLQLNGDLLGTLNAPPFTFQTPVIEYSDNIVNILLVDSTNFKYDIEMELFVPVNTPPELEFEFNWIYSIKQGYFYTSDSIITRLHGEDNLRISYVDYYLDDQYVSTDTINDGYFSLRKMNFGFLPAGLHTTYCIAYDDRGLSTSSDLLSCIIYKALEINEQIIDIKSTSNSSLVYAISPEHLFEIDPVNEEIKRILDLPFAEPTALDASDELQRLFIGFKQGHLVYLEYEDNDFTEIETDTISNIEDLEIEVEYNFAILISHLKVMALDLSTGDHFINGNTTLYEGSRLVYSEPVKNIIAGGNPHVSAGNIYKYLLTHNSIDFGGYSGIGGYADDLFLNPNNKDLLVTTNHYNNGYPAYDITNFFAFLGEYELFHSSTAAYNSDGSKVFLCSTLEKDLATFNSATFSESEHYYIPLRDLNTVNHMISDIGDTKLILTTTHPFDEEVKMIFVRLGFFPSN